MNFTGSIPLNLPTITLENEPAFESLESQNEFPYTSSYLSQKLDTTEARIVQIASLLGITAHKDLVTGCYFFSAGDVTRLRQAIEKDARGESIQSLIGRPLAQQMTQTRTNATSSAVKNYATRPQSHQEQMPQPTAQAPSARPPIQRQTQSRTQSMMTSTDVSVLADAVNNMRDRLMGDVTYLLNEKLAGLDDMVIELVRCKSQLQTLQKQLQETETELTLAKAELNSYKPAAFGLFKKVR